VDAAIENRFSARAFLPTPVPRETLENILRVASRAPSGTNAQPWKVYVLQGAAKDELVAKVCEAHDALREHPELETKYREDYDYYPRHWVEPYLGRRRQNGWSLYGLLGIGKRRQGRDARAAPAQLPLLRRAGGPDVHARPRDGAGQPGRLRHVPAEHHGRGPRARPAHLPPGGVEPLRVHRAAAHRRQRPRRCWCAACRWAGRTWTRAVNGYFTPREPVESFTHWVGQGQP
jgi:nitroreductase